MRKTCDKNKAETLIKPQKFQWKWEMLRKTWCGLNGCQHLKDLWMDAIFGLACLKWSWKLLREGMKDQDFLIWVAKQQKENSRIRPIWVLKKEDGQIFFALAPCHTELQHSCLRDAFYLRGGGRKVGGAKDTTTTTTTTTTSSIYCIPLFCETVSTIGFPM